MSPQKPQSGLSWPSAVDLATDTWIFQAQWGARPDDLSSRTERLLACLGGVASFDPSLGALVPRRRAGPAGRGKPPEPVGAEAGPGGPVRTDRLDGSALERSQG
jgi:hypothetical protein